MYFSPGEEAELLAAFVTVEKAGLLNDVSDEVWDSLPDDFCRDHELDRGRLVTRESDTPGHQSASLRLAIALDGAAKRSMHSGDGQCVKDDSTVERVEEWRRIDDLGTYRRVADAVNGLDEYAVDSSQPFEVRIPFSDLAL